MLSVNLPIRNPVKVTWLSRVALTPSLLLLEMTCALQTTDEDLQPQLVHLRETLKTTSFTSSHIYKCFYTKYSNNTYLLCHHPGSTSLPRPIFSWIPRTSPAFLETLLHPSHCKDSTFLKVRPFYIEDKHKATSLVRKVGTEMFSVIIYIHLVAFILEESTEKHHKNHFKERHNQTTCDKI